MSTKDRIITAVLIAVFLLSLLGLLIAHDAVTTPVSGLPSLTAPFFPGMNMPRCLESSQEADPVLSI